MAHRHQVLGDGMNLALLLASFTLEIRVDSSPMVKSKGEQEAYSAGTQKKGHV